MNFKHCKDCPHREYDGHTDRCSLIIQDMYTGKRKACSQVNASECNIARAHYDEGAYKSAIDDDSAFERAQAIIRKAQERYAAERAKKEGGVE